MGRRREPDKREEILTARVQAEFYQEVKAAAKRNDITMTQIVRQGVRMWMENDAKKAAA